MPANSPAMATVASTLANRRSLNATQRKAPQDLSGAVNGTITGRGGNVQQLGAAAKRRLAAGGVSGGPNTAGGGLNPNAPGGATPPIMAPSERPMSRPAVNPASGPPPGVEVLGNAPGTAVPPGGPSPVVGTPAAMDPGTVQGMRGMGGRPPVGAPNGGFMSPGFTPNLHPKIMQRLAMLRSVQGPQPVGQGQQPAPSVASMVKPMPGMTGGPGGPASPSFTDFWEQPGMGGMGKPNGMGVANFPPPGYGGGGAGQAGGGYYM